MRIECGASSPMEWTLSHLSSQNLVVSPSPRIMCMEAKNRACSSAVGWRSSLFQRRPSSVLMYYNHRRDSVRPILSRSWVPSGRLGRSVKSAWFSLWKHLPLRSYSWWKIVMKSGFIVSQHGRKNSAVKSSGRDDDSGHGCRRAAPACNLATRG
jgi:hypothetical protein